ncbi:germin-like protein 9-3 [Typha latifolia]|uniref:germin-like protein 9-3 n=1 Tax=Typha latifolia TaxID=4733 RepID=UPI003C2D7FA3
MSTNILNYSILLLVLFFAAPLAVVQSSDPDILSDFILPQGLGAVNVNGSFFTYTGMRTVVDSGEPQTFTVVKATMTEFPALNGQSVSYAVLQFPQDSINPPHTHPRSAELLFLVGGMLDVGFVDTENKLYTARLQPGDIFVFPKGLVHFQHNRGQGSAVAISAFGSASAGTVSVPGSVFTAGIDEGVLAKSFKTDVATIQKIKAGLAPKA